MRGDFDDLRRELLLIEAERERCRLVRKHETLEYLKRTDGWGVFGALDQATKALLKADKLLPVNDDKQLGAVPKLQAETTQLPDRLQRQREEGPRLLEAMSEGRRQ